MCDPSMGSAINKSLLPYAMLCEPQVTNSLYLISISLHVPHFLCDNITAEEICGLSRLDCGLSCELRSLDGLECKIILDNL
jgi:hypothetical protein